MTGANTSERTVIPTCHTVISPNKGSLPARESHGGLIEPREYRIYPVSYNSLNDEYETKVNLTINTSSTYVDAREAFAGRVC